MAEMEFGERWDCPACGESNTRGNTNCYSCGAPAPKIAGNHWMCTNCGRPVSRGAKCPGCGAQEPAAQPAGPQAMAVPVAGGVKIVDVDIPFGSLVGFLVKLAFAAIPAAIIIAVIWGVASFALTAALLGAR